MSHAEKIITVFDAAVRAGDGWEKSTKRLSGFLPMLRPATPGARLTVTFEGAAVALLRASPWQGRLASPDRDYAHPDFYTAVRPGKTIEGESLRVRVDGGPEQVIDLTAAPVEIPLAEALPSGLHALEIVADKEGRSCLYGFRILNSPYGSIGGVVQGEKGEYLNDLRVTLSRGGRPVDSRLDRNAFNGQLGLWGLEPGTYDLQLAAVGWHPETIANVTVAAGRETRLPDLHLRAETLAPAAFPPAPKRAGRFRVVKVGHLDTWGQRNAEYLGLIAELTNLYDPDVFLIGNEVNWQYATGAMNRLRVPFLITSGNHGMPGFQTYFGPDLQTRWIGDVFLATYSAPWQQDPAALVAAFRGAERARYRILQGVEGDLPLELGGRLGVDLYACGHGFTAEAPVSATWVHLGKEFHVVDIDLAARSAHVIKVTDTGKRSLDKYPIPRDAPVPVIQFVTSDAGPVHCVTATVVNPLVEAVSDCLVWFQVPLGTYQTSVGNIASQTPLAGAPMMEIGVRVDLPARTPVVVELRRTGSL